MTGTTWYLKKLYSFQTLCLLTRFINEDIAEEVASKLFEIMAYPTHGPIRYYIECFAIRCTILFPKVFSRELIKGLETFTCTVQMQSSLLIILGYLLCSDEVDKSVRKFLDLEEIVLCIAPWLGSTQGFVRACSQLLAHELIPKVKRSPYLDRLKIFLDNNVEMKNLRKKQR